MQGLAQITDDLAGMWILPAIEQLAAGCMQLLQKLADAVDALISPDPAALEFAGRFATLSAIANAIRAKLNPAPVPIAEIMGGIGEVLDESIIGVDMSTKPAPMIDLSKIDFEALRCRFKESPHKNTDLESLKVAIRAQLERLIRLNKTWADFAERRAEVKKVARELLHRLKQLLVLNWRQKSVARSQLKLAIEDVLDTGLPRAYDKPLYERKCSALFEHIYENYPDRDASTYAGAM